MRKASKTRVLLTAAFTFLFTIGSVNVTSADNHSIDAYVPPVFTPPPGYVPTPPPITGYGPAGNPIYGAPVPPPGDWVPPVMPPGGYAPVPPPITGYDPSGYPIYGPVPPMGGYAPVPPPIIGYDPSGNPLYGAVPPMGGYIPPTPPIIGSNEDGSPIYDSNWVPPVFPPGGYAPVPPPIIGYDPSGNPLYGAVPPMGGYFPPTAPPVIGFDSIGNPIYGAPLPPTGGYFPPTPPIIGSNEDGSPIYDSNWVPPTIGYVPPTIGYVPPTPPIIGVNDDGSPIYDSNWVPPTAPMIFTPGVGGPSFGIPELDSNGNVLYIPSFDLYGRQVNVPPPPDYVPQRDSQGNLIAYVAPQYVPPQNTPPVPGAPVGAPAPAPFIPSTGTPIGFNPDGSVIYGLIPEAKQAQSNLSTWGVVGTNTDGSPLYGIVEGNNPNPVVPIGVDDFGKTIFGVPTALQQVVKNNFLGGPTPGFDSYGNSTAIPMTAAASAQVGSWAVVDARGNVIDAIACTEAVCGNQGAFKGRIAENLVQGANCPPAGCAVVMQIPASANTSAALTGFFTDESSKVTFKKGVFTIKTNEEITTDSGATRTVVKTRTIKDGILTDSTGERIELATGIQLPSRITDANLKSIVDTEIKKANIVPVIQDGGILLATPVVFSAIDTNLKYVVTKGKVSRTLTVSIDETGKKFLKTNIDLEGYTLQIKRGNTTLKKVKIA
jgi:hypothetical protein